MKKKNKLSLLEAMYEDYSDKAIDPEYKHTRKKIDDNEEITFDLDIFKELPTPRERIDYVVDTLGNTNRLGRGSSRLVYELPETGKVLKLAMNDKGIAQNKAELDVAFKMHSNSKLSPIVAHIYGHDDFNNPTWLISEQVEVIETSRQANHALKKYGLTWLDYLHLFEYYSPIYGQSKDLLDRVENALQQNPDYFEAQRAKEILTQNEFGKAILELLRIGVSPGDIKVPRHWGITDKDNIVLLDYGLTLDVAGKHYGKPIGNTINFEQKSLVNTFLFKNKKKGKY